MNILGISAFYHDSAACLLRAGQIIAAAQEERFTRKRHDESFPARSIEYCLREGQLDFSQLDAIVYYEKPFLKFERLVETYLAYAPRGFSSFLHSMPNWIQDKLFFRKKLAAELRTLSNDGPLPRLLFAEHHLSHAASAFFASPFESAATLCLDGVGEWATTSAWMGKSNQLEPLWEIRFPHSLGLLYSAMTYYLGFRVNSGEYKVMGLAPYGKPIYVQKIFDHLIDVKPDGSFRMDMSYFDYCTGLHMTNKKFHALFGGPPRKSESLLTQREMDLASSIQVVTEEVVLRLANAIHDQTGAENLCLAGGVALNCVANGRVLREGKFRHIWIQPAAGDAGGALGAALTAWHGHFEMPRKVMAADSMRGAYLGPSFSDSFIKEFLESEKIPYTHLPHAEMLKTVAGQLAQDKVVGWFQGRMEFGPRSLGTRSILGDPRSATMQKTLNLKIKGRESFRPFAPAVLRERVSEYFDLREESPYMLLVAPVAVDKRLPKQPDADRLQGLDLLNLARSVIPAVTHVDYSARVQAVDEATNPEFYALISEFDQLTGCPVLVNTSFNVRGEPIVCTPQDAFRCFARTAMDVLVLGDAVIEKSRIEPETLRKFALGTRNTHQELD